MWWPAHAQLTAYDGFSSINYTAAALLNQNPPINGFSNAWNTGNNIYAGGTHAALVYPGLVTDDSGGAYSLTTGNRTSRDLELDLTGETNVYVSLLMQNDEISASINNYRCFELWNFGNRNLQIGVNRDIDGTGLAWGMRAIDNNSYRGTSTVLAVASETVLAVARITFSTANNGDAVRLWINPGDLLSEANSTNFVQLSGFNFVNNNINRFALAAYSGTASAAGRWDEIRIGTTWTSVLPVPQVPAFAVTYNGNGNNSGAPPDDAELYESGTQVTVRDNTNAMSRINHSFGGWNTVFDGSGLAFDPNDTFLMGATNVVLYAQWIVNPQPSNTYTVTYDGNGNTGGAAPEDVTWYETSTEVTVLGQGSLVRPGYAFAGWNTSEVGSGDGYESGDMFFIGTNHVVLYAQWLLNPSTGQHVRVFVFAGQSNMRGTGTSVKQAPEAWNPLNGVLFDETTTSDAASFSTEWETIGTAVDHMGPEVGFAATLREAYTNETIAIIKVSQSATGLSFWRNPGSAGYETLMGRIDAITNRLNAMVAANAIPDWAFGGFIWMQGENEADGSIGPSETYAADFADMATKVRTKTGVADLPVVLGRISIKLDPAVSPGAGPVEQPQLDNVRSGQVAWATNDVRGGWVNTDDLYLIDSWHFGSLAQLMLGQRMAEAWFGVAETRPSLTLRRAEGQAAKTSFTSIVYTATFHTPVTNFTSSDVVVLGDTGANQVNVEERAPNDGTTFAITITGMMHPGTVDIRVPNAAALADGRESLPGLPEETLVLYTPHAAVTELLVYEPFSSADRPLHRSQTGVGWNGAGWATQNSVTQSYVIASAHPLTYGDVFASPGYASGGFNFNTSARALDLEKTFAGMMTSRGAGAIDVPGTTLWFSYMIRPGDAGQRQRVGLLKGTGETYSDADNAVNVFQNAGTWKMIMLTSTQDTGVAVTSTQTYFMVMRLQMGGATNTSSVHLWVNPTNSILGGAAPDLGTATASATATNANFKFGRLHWYPGSAANHGRLDEVRIGTTFASVTPVPLSSGPADADADGLPDWWELEKFGTITNTPSSDSDEDGTLNGDEYVADTEPLNPASYFKIGGVLGGAGWTNVHVQTDGRSNRYYHLWRTTNGFVSVSQWDLITSSPLLASHTNVVLVDSNQNHLGAAWYKLQVELP
jgi:uncharacterized repeat protein (TIGR02543 family)